MSKLLGAIFWATPRAKRVQNYWRLQYVTICQSLDCGLDSGLSFRSFFSCSRISFFWILPVAPANALKASHQIFAQHTPWDKPRGRAASHIKTSEGTLVTLQHCLDSNCLIYMKTSLEEKFEKDTEMRVNMTRDITWFFFNLHFEWFDFGSKCLGAEFKCTCGRCDALRSMPWILNHSHFIISSSPYAVAIGRRHAAAGLLQLEAQHLSSVFFCLSRPLKICLGSNGIIFPSKMFEIT